jgi:hypothetical protein
MAEDQRPEEEQRWTAKRRAALAISLLKGETTAVEVASYSAAALVVEGSASRTESRLPPASRPGHSECRPPCPGPIAARAKSTAAARCLPAMRTGRARRLEVNYESAALPTELGWPPILRFYCS